ncbi:MAG: light-harvesting protein [Pseudomonadota bacterium]
MNNAKIWLVVPPAVGIPVFLGAVAVGSFATHVAVVTNTGWVDDFISGKELGSTKAEANLLGTTDETVGHASYVMPTADGGQEMLVVLPDGTTATAVLKAPPVLASATTTPPPDL